MSGFAHHRAVVALMIASVPAAADACTLCSCTTSTSSLSFGTYDPVAAAPRDANALVLVDCTAVVSLLGLVEVRVGAGSSGDQLGRTMSRSGTTLRYNLYADIARTQIVGGGNGGTTTVTAGLNGLLAFSTVLPIFGRIPPDQWVGSGTYADTVVITVQY